jgi:hypothetical protein
VDLELFAVCESVIIDQMTNQLTMVNVIETVKAASFPIQMPIACVVSLMRVDPEDIGVHWQARIKVTVPGGESQSHDLPANFAIPSAVKRHRIIHKVEGLPAFQPGQIVLQLLINGEKKATHIIEVEHDDAAASAGKPQPKPPDAQRDHQPQQPSS